VSRVRHYFENAEFAADWPVQFLIIVVGVLLAILEGSLALWSVFFGATPLVTLIFLYWITLHHAKFVTILTPFLIGLVFDLLFSEPIGGRALVYVLLFYYVGLRRQRLLQGEFLQIWFDFTLVLVVAMLVLFAIFAGLFLNIPAIMPMLFQLGTTIALFPVSYLTLFALMSLVQRAKMLS